jgi:hypothetical protein
MVKKEPFYGLICSGVYVLDVGSVNINVLSQVKLLSRFKSILVKVKERNTLEDDMPDQKYRFLLESNEPWTRYRTRIDLMGMAEDDPGVLEDRAAMLDHPQVKGLIEKSASWPGYPLKRHNDAKHPLHAMAVLADFGLKVSDPGMNEVVEKVLSHQTPEGAFETKVQFYKQFGGLEGEYWTWMSCDMTVLLYVMSSFRLEDETPVKKAQALLLSLVEENGWCCKSSPMLGKFKGPGKREDPCPIANLYALRALSLDPDLKGDSRISSGIEMLLHHWEIQEEKKYFLFGIGTDFRKLKYPLIWYDILHYADVLSRFPEAISDPRYKEMLSTLVDQKDEEGLYTAASMYMAWKSWSFGDKKNPSPWLSFLVARILKRSEEG